MLIGFAVESEFLEQPSIDIKRSQMEKWLLPRDKKETRACDSCNTYKMKAIFYDWYHHPSLSFLEDEKIGVICTPCAKREAGSSRWKGIKNE